MEEVQWLTEREERAWRALQFMQMRLEGALARQLAADVVSVPSDTSPT